MEADAKEGFERRGIIHSIHTVAERLSLRRNWVPPLPLPLLPWTLGEQHFLAGDGGGDPIETTGQKAWHSVTACILYGFEQVPSMEI